MLQLALAVLAILQTYVGIVDATIDFDLDPECTESDSSCATNAIQTKVSKAKGSSKGHGNDDRIDCQDKAQSASCLCVFDIDRTLTAAQGGTECPGSRLIKGVDDDSEFTGTFTMSGLSNEGLNQTHCENCYLGIVSAGDADFKLSDERKEILHQILRSKPQNSMVLKMEDMPWSDEEYDSPFVVDFPEGEKPDAVMKVLRFFQRQGICISKSNTYFYDDKTKNIQSFQGSGMNAHQISCKSRDPIDHGVSGFCGATIDELKQEKGISLCKVDCVYSDWHPWGPCSATCGQGTQTRERTRRIEAVNGGKNCSGVIGEMQECPLPACQHAGSDAAKDAERK